MLTIYRVIEAGLQVDSIYTDFSKAFGHFGNCLFLNKLNVLGVGVYFFELELFECSMEIYQR